MPPEPLPWDRKDFFKERKQERSVPPGRWRDSSLYHNGSSREFNRLGSADFRRPPGHGKQGDWHPCAEDSSNGYTPSRYSEKVLDNENSRSYNLRVDGKYGRNSCREGRGYNSHRDGHSWEVRNGSPDKSVKSHDLNSEKRAADDILTYAAHAESDYLRTWDQLHSKEQPDIKATNVTAMGTAQRCHNENSVGSVDWKHRKWSRSVSLSSRGSGFSHSSSSKSLGGVDSFEDKGDLQPKVAVQSPSSDAAACVTSAVPVDDMASRKKQRLGWGEGLAKYEKKKVEGLDGSTSGAGVTITFSNTEPNRSLSSDLVEKSPRILGFSNCASPATPSSVACSSSPGLEEKSFSKVMNVDNDISNSCGSLSLGSQYQLEGLSFNLEKSDAISLTNVGSSLFELLQSDNPCSLDSGFVRSTALNKLFMWKSDALEALEMTESEIDLLENQLKSLKSESQSRSQCAVEHDSFPLEQNLKPCEEQGPKPNLITRPVPLEIYPCVDAGLDKIAICNGDLEVNGDVKDKDIDSPGTATSKFKELAPPVKDISLSEIVKGQDCSDDLVAVQSTNAEVTCVASCPSYEQAASSLNGDDIKVTNFDINSLGCGNNGVDVENDSCNVILENNKELSSRSSEVFNKLLPKVHCNTGVCGASTLACLHSDLRVREKFAMRRLSLKFKEKVLSLKHKAYHYQWKEDLRLLSERKYRFKYQKKYEASPRVMANGHQTHRSFNRSRFASPGNLNLVLTTDAINFARKLLSESQVKLYRNALKMPSLILDERERLVSRFISSNGLIEDPCAVEKERSIINPWTSEEKEIFMDKLAMFGKDFRKIASFLDHKTTADCVEFYYKNHKSDGFEKVKKPDLSKQGKSSNNTYLLTSGTKWNRQVNAASLDILGAASVIAARAETAISNRQLSGKIFSGGRSESKAIQIDDEFTERSSSFDFLGCDRETVAADVLAGICGSMSSEAMSSCITSSVDPVEGYHDWKCQKVDSVMMRPSMSDVTQNVDEDTCSDESCGEMDSVDWTNEEKLLFIQAVSSYGKDFAMISRSVGTRSRDQCKVFYSKARKCLGLDSLHSRPGIRTPVSDTSNGGGSDTEDACVLESSVVGSDKSGSKADEDLPIMDVNHYECDPIMTVNLQIDLNISEENRRVGVLDDENSGAVETKGSDLIQLDDALAPSSKTENNPNNVSNCKSSLQPQKSVEIAVVESGQNSSTSERISVAVPVSVCEAVNPCQPSLDAHTELKSVDGCSITRCMIDLEMQKPSTTKFSLDDLEEKCHAGMSNGNYVTQDSVVTCKDSCMVAIAASSANLHQVPIELDTREKTLGVSLPEESAFAPGNTEVHHSEVQVEKVCNQAKLLSPLNLHESTQDGRSASRDECTHLQGPPSLTPVQSTQIPSICQMDIPIKREMNGDISSRLISEVQRLPKTDGVAAGPCAPHDCYLQKGNSSRSCCSIAEPPLLSQNSSQTGDQRKTHSRSLSDTEKPSRNGNVKLFGQILNSGSHEAEDKGNRKSANAKSVGHQSMVGSSSLLNFSRDSYSGLENVPIRTYGFWDGNRIQTGLSSLPDSSILMAKYPAAFGNFSASSRKEQQLPMVERNSDRNFNGVSAFTSREINSSNGLLNQRLYRVCDAVDMKQRPDILSEMRRHGFDGIPSFQQQGKGMAGVNAVGGRGEILVGGPCPTSVLDPVVAMRLHFAKTEQYGGQSGSIIRGEESWRGKGDIGK